MLATQVQYWNYVESRRHNMAMESWNVDSLNETKRHNLANEKETVRHNVAGEVETQRHNVAGEYEIARHNREQEVLGYQSLIETQRHNLAGESYNDAYLREQTRHNRVSEQNDQSKLEIQRESNRIKSSELEYKSIHADAAKSQAETAAARMEHEKSMNDFTQLSGWINMAGKAAKTVLDIIV